MMLHILAALVAVLAVVVIIVDFIFLLPTIHGAIYLPSDQERVRRMIALLKIKKGDHFIDIGSGDGRLVIAAAQAGADAAGCEINPFLVLQSRWKIRRAGLASNARIYWATLWWMNYAPYNKIAVFGISYIMHDLEKKLRRQLHPNALVVANSFPFPHWKPITKEKELYLYSSSDLSGTAT